MYVVAKLTLLLAIGVGLQDQTPSIPEAINNLYILSGGGSHLHSSASEPNGLAQQSSGSRQRQQRPIQLLRALGPGCVTRIWLAGNGSKKGPPFGADARIRIELDNNKEPLLEMPIRKIISEAPFPFKPPLVKQIPVGPASEKGAFLCHVPIAFARSIRITAWGIGDYAVDYRLYNRRRLRSLKLPLNDADNDRFARTAILLQRLGEDPKGPHERTVTIQRSGLILAGGQLELRVPGPAVIDAIILRFDPPLSPQQLRDVTLQISYDGRTQPSVRVPVGDFFGVGATTAQMKTLLIGRTEKGLYCYFPMPLAREAKLLLSNQGRDGVKISRFTVSYHKLNLLPTGTGYFHAAYLQQWSIAKREPMLLLQTAGIGRLVGMAVTIQPARPWDRIRYLSKYRPTLLVDGNKPVNTRIYPGLEAYFALAGSGLPGPFASTVTCQKDYKGLRAVRIRALDAVDFRRGIKLFIPDELSQPRDFWATAYWYQQPPVAAPPLPPAAMRWPRRGQDELLQDGLTVAVLKPPSVAGKPLPVLAWEKFTDDCHGGQAYFIQSAGGEKVTLLVRPMIENDYDIRFYLACGRNFGNGKILLDGEEISTFTCRTDGPSYCSTVEINEVHLSAAVHSLQLQLDPPADPQQKNYLALRGVRISSRDLYVKDWNIVGPFGNHNNQGFNTPYMPEQNPYRKSFLGKDGHRVSWRDIKADENNRIQPSGLIKKSWSSLAYCLSYIHSPQAVRTYLAIEHNDGVKIWLGRKLIHSDPKAGSSCIPIILRKGTTPLLIKTANVSGAWWFRCALADPNRNLQSSRTPRPLPSSE